MKIDFFDILVILGFIVLCVGLWLFSPAISLCVFGILISIIGIIGSSKNVASKKGGDS